ncbi:hypothetical protein EJ110_NYTH48641 [Nymphaea thermarum]|nr:hypothetical protein EJ110_NYTH48641 [Nymphaea thermarum]
MQALGFEFANDEFHQYVHGRLPYENLTRPSFEDLAAFNATAQNNKAHAARVLCWLGLEGCFDRIICFETVNPFEIQAASDRSFLDENGKSCADSDHSSASESTESTKRGCPACFKRSSAFQSTINIAAINPQRTVGFSKIN